MTRRLRLATRTLRPGAGTPAPDPVYAPSSDASLFFRLAGAPVDDGSGKASQWNDLTAGARHATQSTANRRPTITLADANFNGKPSVGGGLGVWRMTCGGAAVDWVRSHDTTYQKVWIVFKPSSSATVATEMLWSEINDIAAGGSGIGLGLIYNGSRQSIELYGAKGTSPRMVVFDGAAGECARNVAHIALLEKDATTWTLWLDGALAGTGEWGSATPSSSTGIVPRIGGESGYDGTRDFIGSIAEIGMSSTTTFTAAQIMTFLRTEYGVAATRTPNYRMIFSDAENYTALSRNVVRSYFTLLSTTPGASQDVIGVYTRGFSNPVKTRTNGEPWPDTILNNTYYSWCERLSGLVGTVAAGKTRVLIGVALSDSTGSGRDIRYNLLSGLSPAYPPGDTSLWKVDDEHQARVLTEPVDQNMAYVIDSVLSEGPAPGVGPSGLFGRLVQQSLGSGYEVGVVNCSRGGSFSGLYTYAGSVNNNWAVSTARGTYFGAAIAKLQNALRIPNTVLGGVFISMGGSDAFINPASESITIGANLAAGIAQIRTTLGLPNLKFYVMQTNENDPPSGDVYLGRSAVRSQIAALHNPAGNVIVIGNITSPTYYDPDGHYAVESEIRRAQKAFDDGWALYPGYVP